jgi:hypothetical protein
MGIVVVGGPQIEGRVYHSGSLKPVVLQSNIDRGLEGIAGAPVSD